MASISRSVQLQYLVAITPTSPICGSGRQGRTSFGFVFQRAPTVVSVAILTLGFTANVTTSTTEVVVCLLGTLSSTVYVRVTIVMEPITGVTSVASFALDNLTDVELESPEAGHVLIYDAATELWQNQGLYDAGVASAGHGHTLGGLSNVTIVAPGDEDLLAYDLASGEWINQAAAEAGLALSGHTHSLADLDLGASGTVETTDAFLVIDHGIVVEIVYKPPQMLAAQQTAMVAGILLGAAMADTVYGGA